MKTQTTILIAFAVAFAISVSCEDGLNEEKPILNNKSNFSAPNKSLSSARVAEYAFNGLEGDPLALETARLWTANYKTKNPDDIQAHFFGSEIITRILSEAGCVGIRMYYAIDDNGQKQLILVGVDADGNNLLPGTEMLDGSDENIIADYSWPCPSYCSDDGL
jgi:hypothetical protein